MQRIHEYNEVDFKQKLVHPTKRGRCLALDNAILLKSILKTKSDPQQPKVNIIR